MARWVEWIEPLDGTDRLRVCRTPVEDAVAHMKEKHPYTDDAIALEDFMVIHWGYIKEYEDYNGNP